MVGREVEQLYPCSPPARGEAVLELDGLASAGRPARASLTLRRGEALGIAGLVGAGRTEFLRCVFGLEAALARLDELRRRHDQTQKSIRAVLNVGDRDEGFMADELNRLNAELKALDHSIHETEAQPAPVEPMGLDRVADALRAIDPVWDVLFPEEQQRIVQLLVEDITVSTTGIDVRFRTNGIEQVVEELQSIEEQANA